MCRIVSNRGIVIDLYKFIHLLFTTRYVTSRDKNYVNLHIPNIFIIDKC